MQSVLWFMCKIWILNIETYLCSLVCICFSKPYPKWSPAFFQVCHTNPSERGRFIRCIYNLLQSSSAAVRYEAAGTLITLSSAPTAVKVKCSVPDICEYCSSDSCVTLSLNSLLSCDKETSNHIFPPCFSLSFVQRLLHLATSTSSSRRVTTMSSLSFWTDSSLSERIPDMRKSCRSVSFLFC